MNKLPEWQLQGRKFRFEFNADGTRPMAQVTDTQQAYAKFERGDAAITIQSSTLTRSFLVRVRWDEGVRSCKLYVDDNRFEVWELSQWVLGPIFFPN